MQAYDFDIEYVRGKHNVLADALFQRPASLSLMSICHDWKAQLLVEYSKDRRVCEILEGTHADECYRMMYEVIYYKGHIFLVPNSQLREIVLQAAHDSPLSRHQWFRKTYMTVREHFTWKGLKGDLLKHLQECEACQRNKRGADSSSRIITAASHP